MCEGIASGFHNIKLMTRECDLESNSWVLPGPMTIGYITGTTFVIEEVRLEWLPMSLSHTGNSM